SPLRGISTSISTICQGWLGANATAARDLMVESVCFISIVFPLNSLTKLPYLSNIATVYTLELTLKQVFFTVFV
ncbi:hypothetical protein LN386_23415, partial [Enterobacter hormaechei subsp. steigerwaltii]|nr:hypothetical protein [Enterobacter hormaechei subsp. steigerwaltii]